MLQHRGKAPGLIALLSFLLICQCDFFPVSLRDALGPSPLTSAALRQPVLATPSGSGVSSSRSGFQLERQGGARKYDGCLLLLALADTLAAPLARTPHSIAPNLGSRVPDAIRLGLRTGRSPPYLLLI